MPNHEVHAAETFTSTVLPAADVAEAIDNVDAWLRTARLEPDHFSKVLDDCSYTGDVTNSLREALDLREEGAFKDDGDCAPHLFGFLAGLRAILLQAKDKGWAVVHVRYVFLFRSVPSKEAGA